MEWMIERLRRRLCKALTNEKLVQERSGPMKIYAVSKYPSEILIMGMLFALLALICLSTLEATYMLVFRQWSTEIFTGIMSTVTFILGAIFGART